MAETKTTIPVEIKMGNAGTNDANLPAFKEGSIIFTKDTKKIYIDPVGETERIAVGGTDASNKQDNLKLKLEDTTISPAEDLINLEGLNNLSGQTGIFSTKITTPIIAGSSLANSPKISFVANSIYADGYFAADKLIADDFLQAYNIVSNEIGNDSQDLILKGMRVKVANGLDTTQTAPLVGVSTPVSEPVSNTFYSIKEAEIPYQAANKKYVDTEIEANKITVDSALYSTSENPVQNKVVTAALEGKQAKITESTALTIATLSSKNSIVLGDVTGVGAKLNESSLQFFRLGINKPPILQFNPSAGTDETTLTLTAFDSTGTKAVNTRLTNIATPKIDTDAANKKYVDTKQDKITEATNLRVSSLKALSSSTNYVDVQANYINFFNGDAAPLLYISPQKYTSSTSTQLNLSSYAQASSIGHSNVVINGVDTPTVDNDAVNKKYVDDIKTELLNAITHPYTYDEDTKELTLIL